MKSTLEEKYTVKMELVSARFGFLADLILLMYGGSFKIREKLSGRFGDIVSNLYIISSVLRKLREDNNQDFEPIAHYAIEDCFSKIDKATSEIYANLSHNSLINRLVKIIFLFPKPSNLSSPLSDKFSYKIVKNIVHNNAVFENIFSNTFNPKAKDDRLFMLTECFKEAEKAHSIIKKVKKVKVSYENALKTNIITSEEHNFITRWEEAVKQVVQVDDFPLVSNAFKAN